MTKDKIRKLKDNCRRGLFGPFEFKFTDDNNQPHRLISKHGVNVLELLAWDIPNLILEYEKLQMRYQILEAQNTASKIEITPTTSASIEGIYRGQINQYNKIIDFIKDQKTALEIQITSTPGDEDSE